MINTVTLAMKFYHQPEYYTQALDVLNMVFTTVFALEFVFKLAAFRFKVSNSLLRNVRIIWFSFPELLRRRLERV
jgi:Ion transport protein